MKSRELLVELGVEEIPASMVRPAAEQFAQRLGSLLKEARLAGTLSVLWYTPRRIIVGMTGLPARQPNLTETVTGPPRTVAFDVDGKPSRAAEAFASKNGITLDKAKIIKTPKGEYLAAVRTVRGEKTAEILRRIIPAAAASIQFPKTMHWSPDRFRFVRPIRWVVALLNGKVLDFTLAHVASGRYSAGHRFLGKPRIAVNSIENLRQVLLANGVVSDPALRLRRIEDGLAREAAAAGGKVIPDPELLETVVNLNECPSVIRGSFEPRFLELPQEILVTVMREHQKYFSVVDATGRLLPVFLAVINTDIPDPAKIRAGHERVLRARLADAAFFWETDRKVPLGNRVESLRNVLFQQKLGSYFDKTERVRRLVPSLAASVRLDNEAGDLAEAARLMKCDLVTEMVKEFADLQGVVGGLYARAEGRPETVWRPIYEQYLPKSSSSEAPSTRGGAVLALADKLDTVCGCFSAGLIPSGSRDPFAVRRNGNGVLKILLDHGLRVSLEELVSEGLEPFSQSPETRTELLKFFEGRLRFLLEEAGCKYDCVNAALAVAWDDPVDAQDRVLALQAMQDEVDFLSVASNFKRIANILAQAGPTSDEPDPALMSDEEERVLWDAYRSTRDAFEAARTARRYHEALRLLATMRGPIDAFFEKVLVMAPDSQVRANRIALLSRLAEVFRSVADISQVVLERK